MRILLWHGWLLEGSGSNVYTARLAEVLRRRGHDVLLLCQEPHPERYGFVDAFGPVDADGPGGLIPTGAPAGAGRCVLLRPRIGPLIPVFVLDEYEGLEARRFVELSDAELEAYLQMNVAALRAAAAWHRPEAVLAGHAIPGAVVARRALGAGAYLAKVHGSDLEYGARAQPRLAALAREGLEGAISVAGGSRDVLARAVEFAPSVAGRLAEVPPGVDIDRFRPRPPTEALELAASLLEADPDTSRGRPERIGSLIERQILEPVPAFDQIARSYDQSVPDPDAGHRLRAVAAGTGPLVAYFGKLIPEKGPELFVQALALQSPRMRGLIVGFGDFREWIEAVVSALDSGRPEVFRRLAAHGRLRFELEDADVRGSRGLRERTSFTGRLDHRYAPLALSAADVLVVPSVLDEAFAMVVVEGAACGALPLVARHSGLAEVSAVLEAEVGRPGLFSFAPGAGAVRRIAAGLERLLALPEAEREEHRRRISALVGREWTWERTADRLLLAAGIPAG
ncbi:MAG TPA: glycosyltransferase [Actinomycetota bacterium]